MTANQINYLRHLEDNRHNLETESQGRKNLELTEKKINIDKAIGTANAVGNVAKGFGSLIKSVIPIF